jgi:hypothetical protein
LSPGSPSGSRARPSLSPPCPARTAVQRELTIPLAFGAGPGTFRPRPAPNAAQSSVIRLASRSRPRPRSHPPAHRRFLPRRRQVPLNSSAACTRPGTAASPPRS